MVRTVKHWTDSTHWDLTDVAALRMGLSPSKREILRHHVLEPDNWGILDKIRHYMPLCSIFAGELTVEAISEAKTSIGETGALEKLGNAMHFLQDAGNPWHACPLLPVFQQNHTVYEEYVAKNMRNGFCFRRALIETPVIRPFHTEFIGHIGNGAAYLARQAVTKFSFLDSCIRNDPDWEECEKVAEVTVSILTSCMQMCETQIHAYSLRAAARAPRPISLPIAVTWTFLGSEKRRLTA
jgi:hypothetical protein